MTSDWNQTPLPHIANPVIYSAHFDTDSSDDDDIKPFTNNYTIQINRRTRRFKRPSQNQSLFTGIPTETMKITSQGGDIYNESIQNVQHKIASLKLELAQQEAKLLRMCEAKTTWDSQHSVDDNRFEREEKKTTAVKAVDDASVRTFGEKDVRGQVAPLHLTGADQPFDWSGFRKEKQQTTLEKATQTTDIRKEHKLTAETIAEHLEEFRLEEQKDMEWQGDCYTESTQDLGQTPLRSH